MNVFPLKLGSKKSYLVNFSSTIIKVEKFLSQHNSNYEITLIQELGDL